MRINNKRFFRFLLCFTIGFVVLGCNSEEIDLSEQGDEYVYPKKETLDTTTRLYESVLQEDGLYHDVPRNEGVKNVQKRVDQYLNVKWEPFHDIPMYPKGYYQANSSYCGIPYSFAAESDGIVGLDISIYTFLTSLMNPYSYIYSVDLRESPYNEILAGPYYGCVCSSAVAFFCGMDFHYVTYLLDTSPWIVRLPEQEPDQIRVGDIIWKNNHVMLIYDIARYSDNRIARVTIAEGNVPLTRTFTISYDEFLKRWNNESYVIYCYTRIGNATYNPSQLECKNVGRLESAICTARGDSVCFRKGEDVIINSLATPSCSISLYKDGKHYRDYTTENHFLQIKDLDYGNYIAINEQEDQNCRTVFSVVDYSVQLSRNGNGSLRVQFNSNNAIPKYVSFCNSNYSYLAVYPLSKEDVLRGYIIVPNPAKGSYVRVFYYGEFGRISSPLQQIPS